MEIWCLPEISLRTSSSALERGSMAPYISAPTQDQFVSSSTQAATYHRDQCHRKHPLNISRASWARRRSFLPMGARMELYGP